MLTLPGAPSGVLVLIGAERGLCVWLDLNKASCAIPPKGGTTELTRSDQAAEHS